MIVTETSLGIETNGTDTMTIMAPDAKSEADTVKDKEMIVTETSLGIGTNETDTMTIMAPDTTSEADTAGVDLEALSHLLDRPRLAPGSQDYLDDVLRTLYPRAAVAWSIPHTTTTHYYRKTKVERQVAEDIISGRIAEPRRHMEWSIPVSVLKAFWEEHGYSTIPNVELFRDGMGAPVKLPPDATLSKKDSTRTEEGPSTLPEPAQSTNTLVPTAAMTKPDKDPEEQSTEHNVPVADGPQPADELHTTHEATDHGRTI
ncbi:MAG: hypothetical protein Q9208_003490 [Pyrenodesmia sp. 3 TL-2023]